MLEANDTKAISLAEFGRFFSELPFRAQATTPAAVATGGTPVATRRTTSFAPCAARRASASNLNEGFASPVRSACVSKRPAYPPPTTAALLPPFAAVAETYHTQRMNPTSTYP